MKSLRDLVERMPETRRGLEETVLAYAPEVAQAIKDDPQKRRVLEESVDRSFDKYRKYIGGATQKLSAAGHGVGYAADAWLMTGDIFGSLGGKFLHVLAQIPEKAYSIAYGIKTGNYTDSLQNIFEGIVSYLPGFTIADEGLSRIVQKRMVKDVVYDMEDKLRLEHKPWFRRVYERIKDKYTGVRDRSDRIVSPRRGKDVVYIKPEDQDDARELRKAA